MVKPTMPFIPGSKPKIKPTNKPKIKKEKCCSEKIVCSAESTESITINKERDGFPSLSPPLIETLAAFSLRVSL